MIEREREREGGGGGGGGGGKKRKPFFDDFTGFCRSELDRSRAKAALRDEGYTWVLESQDFIKVQGLGFYGNREKGGVSRNQAN